MREKVKKLLLYMLVFVALGGCDILRDSPFKVLAWSPGEGTHLDFTGPAITLEFSHEPDRYSVERSFTCTEDGLALRGTFAWEGRRLSFYPAGGIIPNRDYRISIATDAQDGTGLSLEEAFEGRFSTRPDGNRMVLLETNPADEGILGPGLAGPCMESVTLTFSRALKVESLYQYVSFSPTMQGLWTLEAEGTLARFTPSQAWQNGRTYVCTIGKDLPDCYDRPMGQSYRLHFSVGEDREPPRLITIKTLDAGGSPVQDLSFTAYEGDEGPDTTIPVNEYFERTYKIALEFSEPVDPATVKNRLSFQSSLGYSLSPPYPASANLILTFTEPPIYGTVYTLSISRGVGDSQGNTSTQQVLTKFLVNGPASKPPRFIGIRLPLAPGGGPGNEEPASYSKNDAFGNLPISSGTDHYPFDVPTDTWIEFYFDVAQGANINLFSLMNSLNLSATNGALSFAPRSMKNSDFTWNDPVPGWENYERIEVRGRLTNGTNGGIVTVSLSADLADSLGNRAGQIQSLPLLK
uniref:SbsA Ig-like domain-containing protein n=1 Tax=Gracilinema caldarium TaxID=215591 RepID=A0A7C3EMD9_9SPIR